MLAFLTEHSINSNRKSKRRQILKMRFSKISIMLTTMPRTKSTRIKLYPPLPEHTVENLKTVVALNIGFDRLTWVVEDSDRRLIDWRRKIFFDKPNFHYNHVLYQEKLLEAVNSLPSSDIYLIESSRRQTRSLGKVKYLIDASVIEAMIVTFVNATKGEPMVKRSRQEMEPENLENLFDRNIEDADSSRVSLPQYAISAESDSELSGVNSDLVYELTNKVYVYHNKNFVDIYDNVAGGERVNSFPFVTELIRKGTGPLAGLRIPSYFHSEILCLSNLQEQEALARCLLMSDSVVQFCQSLSFEDCEEILETDLKEN